MVTVVRVGPLLSDLHGGLPAAAPALHRLGRAMPREGGAWDPPVAAAGV